MADAPIFNPDKLRAYTSEVLGFALYDVTIDGSKATGHHRGLVRTEADAKAWIDGDDSVEIVQFAASIGFTESKS